MVAHSEKRWGRDPLEQTRLDVYVGVKNVLKLNSQLKFGHSEKGIKFEKIFHFQFDITQKYQNLCHSQKGWDRITKS